DKAHSASNKLNTIYSSNQFQGMIFNFIRNDALNATVFFLNRAGQTKQQLRYNNYGFNFNGPVVLPRFGEGGKPTWNGKNRFFFFWSEEWRRERRGTVVRGRVPSALEKIGDFSEATHTDVVP